MRFFTVVRTRPELGVGLHLDRQRSDQHQAAGVEIIAAADDQIGALVPQGERQLARPVAIVFAIAQGDRRLVVRADAGQVDLRDAAQAPLQEAELHQVDAIDLQVAGGDVSEFQLHLGRLARLEGDDLGQFDRLVEEVGDRLLGVDELVFDTAIFADRVGGSAQAVIDLAEDVNGLPLVAAGLLTARVGIDPRGLGHLAAHLQRCLVLAAGEMAVAHHVPEAIQQFALGIAIGVAIARGGGVLVGPQVQQRGGPREGGLIGGRIVGILRQEALQHPPRPAHQVYAVELRAVQFDMNGRAWSRSRSCGRGGSSRRSRRAGTRIRRRERIVLRQLEHPAAQSPGGRWRHGHGVGGHLRRLGIDVLGQGVGGLGDVALRWILAQHPAQDVDAAQEVALLFQESGHAAVALEAALDRRPEDQIAPFELAHVVVCRPHLHDLGERNLVVRPLLLDDLEVADHLGRRAKLQMDIQEHSHRLMISLRVQVPFFQQVSQTPAGRLPLAPLEMALA